MTKAKSSKSTPYRVRESARAKHVSIRVSHFGEVEVVVPRGFDLRRIPEILHKRQDWIAKTTQRLVAERRSLTHSITGAPSCDLTQPIFPEQIHLRSLLEDWDVKYDFTPAVSPITARTLSARKLLVQGEMDETACYQLLKLWLKRKAELHLIPWLRLVSQEVELPCDKISVRAQKTIWASCSGRKNVSLNLKLLFLPPHLVRYVFIHELCHTIHLNHSRNFWSLVEEKEPDYRLLDTELNKGWVYIPEWLEKAADL
ncbi:MAG: M48 family metallopeptidase [Oculatellaceae cyanobacterium Prado106]|jgi:hypothetical protein|nr:M48 family metallopeptidase [Oculatellaceae cyanobacterium Prado106]